MVCTRNTLGWCVAAYGLILVVSTVSLSCESMREQPSFQPQQAPRPGMASGIVSTRGLPPAVDLASARDVTNPIASTPESIIAGQKVFGTYCVTCHGEDGRGGGPVGQHFVPPPMDLTADFMDNVSDGQLFAMISSGIGRMPPFQTDLGQEERWNVINYVRTFRD